MIFSSIIMISKLNIIFKLKLLSLTFLFISNKNKKVKNPLQINWVFLYYFKQIQLNYLFFNQGYKNINLFNANLKKLLFFKNNYVNSLFFYNIINYKKNYKKFTNNLISNYNPYSVFFYYNQFVKNVNINSDKYYTNFYQNNLYFIRFFIFKYLNTFLKNKNLFLSLQKDNIKIIEKSILYKTLIKKTRRLGFLKEISFKIKSFINLVLICLYNKDIILLKNTVKGILEKLHFKKHKKFLYNLRVLLKSIAYIFFYKFKCLGLYIKVKGKIGVGGNSKKRIFIFKLGSFSFTKKSQKLTYAKDSIRTYSGVLGFESYLTYK